MHLGINIPSLLFRSVPFSFFFLHRRQLTERTPALPTYVGFVHSPVIGSLFHHRLYPLDDEICSYQHAWSLIEQPVLFLLFLSCPRKRLLFDRNTFRIVAPRETRSLSTDKMRKTACTPYSTGTYTRVSTFPHEVRDDEMKSVFLSIYDHGIGPLKCQ